MGEKSGKTVVNSWNEWDPLKRVIVGRADGTMVQAPEPNVHRDWPEHGFPAGTYGRVPKEMEDKANEQLDNFADIMEKRGIQVDRPTPLDFSQTVQTPDWVQDSMFGCMPPRDVLLVIGNEILETTMCYRSRWFEYLCYRPLLEQYFRQDPNFKWASAPKPRLTDESYVAPDFWQKVEELSEEQQLQNTYNKRWNITEKEPLFDAADMARCGKDLVMQRSSVTNAAGIDWLRRHYPDHRVHDVTFEDTHPMHIDGTFVPIRPGLVLYTGGRSMNRPRGPLQPELIQLFEQNGWEVVPCAKPLHEEKLPLSFCSIWLSINILMLDPNTVCVEASEKAQMEQFDKLGLEVIPVPFWDVAAFGGGLHCATVDVYREGDCEDYLPKQIPGF